jgi:hypothetical protein
MRKRGFISFQHLAFGIQPFLSHLRLLLGEAMERPEAPDQFPAIDGDHFPLGEGALEHR